MRKLVSGFASSLDGYIEGAAGEYDWITIDKEIDFNEQAKRYDAYFYGRRTYEALLNSNMPPVKGAVHYVFSKSLTEVAKGFILVKGDIKKEIKKIKEQEGKDIALFGGASLLASLLELDLVDEFTISVIPVLLGKGKPMVNPLSKRSWLKLTDTRTYANGTVMLNYEVEKKVDGSES